MIISQLSTIIPPYPAVLLDAYGVFWGGNHFGLFPGAAERMADLVSQGKIVGILSNSTQLAEKEIAKVASHGLIQGPHFHFFMTSGSATKQLLTHSSLPFNTPRKKYWLLGELNPGYSSHISIFENTAYTETPHIEEADFIYIMVPHINGVDQTDPTLFKHKIESITHHHLPMVCPNPDRFAHEGNPPRPVVRQGSIAELYESMGGTVFYIGKPYPLIYSEAISLFAQHGITDLKQILMIGDTPETDIRGGNKIGMSTALLTSTGIASERISQQGFSVFSEALPDLDRPDFFIERLA